MKPIFKPSDIIFATPQKTFSLPRKENPEFPCNEVGQMEKRLAESGSPLYSEGHRIMYDFPIQHWCKGARVLEVGIGYGYGISVLAANSTEVVGIDTDMRCIEYAKEKYPFSNVKYEYADISTWSESDGVFDVAVMIDVIEHIHKDNRAISNVSRLLKPGGLLFISTPWPYLGEEGNPINPHHIREYYPEEFIALIRKSFSNAVLYSNKNDNMMIVAQKDISTCALSEKQEESLLIHAPEEQLRKVIAGRNIGILLHGKSIAELEHKIVDFADEDICWCSMNFFGIIEEKILHKIGKNLDVVFCSSRQEIINREQELRAFLQRNDDNVLVSTAEALSNVPSLLGYAQKIVTVAEPHLPKYLMPNSLTLLIEALVTQGGANRMILFGADGLLATDVSVSSSYFGGEVLAKQNRVWLLVNDTVLFNSRFPLILNRDLNRKAIPPPCILNCSPGSVLTPFPIIHYQDVLRLLGGELSWPVIPVQTGEVVTSPANIVGECCDYLIVMAGPRCFLVKDRSNVENGSLENPADIDAYERNGICIECISVDAAKEVAGMLDRVQSMLLEQYRGFNVIPHNGRIIAVAKVLGELNFSNFNPESMKSWQDQGMVFFAPSLIDMHNTLDQSGYEPSPLLVEENVGGYSIVKLGYKYLALSHELGPIDPATIDIKEFQTPGREHLVYIDNSFEGAIDSIKGAKKMASIIAGGNPTYGTTFKINRAVLFDGLQPWRKTDKQPKEINPIPSMICDDECAYYHWLARYYFTGEGSIIDFGPLAGGSTYSFASGLELNSFVNQSGNRYIHSYDLWDFFPDWQRFFPDTKIVEGTNLVSHVEHNLGNMLRFVDMHKGDIGAQRWDGSPIEIMFVDAAKSSQTWQHMLLEFFPSLIPGKSIVIHQDWVCLECPWIHITMNMLKDYFVYVDSPDGGSVAFLLVKPIPEKLLRIDCFNEFSIQQCLQLFDECSSNMTNWHRIHIELASVNYLLLKGERSEAKSRLKKIIVNNYQYKDMASSSIQALQAILDSQLENVEQPVRQQVLSTSGIPSIVSRESILFSFLIPTRGRPDLVARLFQSIVDTTSNLADLEIILVIDDDDELSKDIRDERINFKTVVVLKGLSMGALNQACYRASSGRYIMLMNDDVVLRTPGWDRVVLGAFTQFRDDIALIHVNDLLFRERLCTFPFLSRTACEMIGLCPEVYQRYKIDDHIYEIYSMLAHLGHKRIIYLPDVIFEHENHAAHAGPDASEQHVFVSQDNKMYVPHGPTIEKDDKAFTERNNERKSAALTLAAHIEGHRVKTLHESTLGMYADKLDAIKEPYSFRKPGFLTVQPCKQQFSSITHRTTIAVVCSDIRKEMTRRCIATIKEYTENYDLLILDNAGSREFNHPSEMNKVLKSVSTDFLVLMDDDVFVESGWLDGLLKCIDEKTAVVAPVHRGKAPFTGAYLMGDGQGTHAHTIDIPFSPREMQCYCSAILLIDVRKVGHILMEEKYNKYFFDLVHGLMVWEAGYRSVCTPEVVVTHVGGGTMNWGTSTANQLVEADRLNFVEDWIDSGRLARLEQGIWKDYPYLAELLHIPKRIKQLGSELSYRSPGWLLNEINELWIASEDKELFRNLLNDELANSLNASPIEQAKDAPHVLIALGERLCDLGFNEPALVCMKNALQADRDCVEAWIWIAAIARKMGDPKLYAIGYEQAASRNPQHPLFSKVIG